MPIVEIKGEIENIMVRIRIKDKKIGKHVIRPDNLLFFIESFFKIFKQHCYHI